MFSSIIQQFGAACMPGSGFTLNIPTWYKYLDCEDNTPVINSLSDVWDIAAAILEIIVYIGGVAAVFFVIYGGIQFITSHGQPDKVAQARSTIINALAGLIIAVLAIVTVRYIAGAFNAGEIIHNPGNMLNINNYIHESILAVMDKFKGL